MPVYEYRCRQCGERTEVLQHVGDAPLGACPQCGGTVEKLISAPALRFKGSGWYVTDYAGGTRRRASEAEKAKPETTDTSKPAAKATPPATESS